MLNFLNNRVFRRFRNFVINRYDKIKVKPGKCRYNFRCHNNAVHEALKHHQTHIAMVVYIDDGQPIVHFINHNGKNFVDNTLGEWSTQHEYYFVRWIGRGEFFRVYQVFHEFRKFLRSKLTWWERLFSDYDG